MSRIWQDVAYPLGDSLETFFELKEDKDVLKTSLINILLTLPGERVMRPEFGSELPNLLFEPNDEVLVSFLESSVREAIARWDDRIELVQITSERDGHNLDIRIVFQFALEPTETIVLGLGVNLDEQVINVFERL